MAIREINWNAINDEMKTLGKKPEKKVFEKKVDENLYVTKLKDGMSTVLLRFLPMREDDVSKPIAEVHSHSYMNEHGKWLFHKCPKTTSKTAKCPTCDMASKYWNGGNADLAKKLFKSTRYYVNVLIINDFNTPENNGKVFVMRIGKKLLEKINKKMFPSEEDMACGEEGVNVFDYITGLNFKLVIKEIEIKNAKGEKATQLNYDSSEWTKVSTRIGVDPKKPFTDKEIAELEENLIPLKPYVTLAENENYEALKVRLDKFMGFAASEPVAEETQDEGMPDFLKMLADTN